MTIVTATGATAPQASQAPATGGTKPLGKDDFLRLLITQLKNQDPLNPLDQNQFLAQTAQFTSLEHLQNIRSGLDALAATASGSALVQGASLLGRTVSATGREIERTGRGTTSLPFTVDGGAGAVTIEVLDGNGGLARRLTADVPAAGAYSVTWDGRDTAGATLEPGRYTYRIVAPASMQARAATGTVTGLALEAGRLVLEIDGVRVAQADIVDVR